MRYRTADVGVGEAEVTDIFPGNILWFAPPQVDTTGQSNHPVLVLCRSGKDVTLRADIKAKRENAEVTVLLLTTFKGKLLHKRFPSPKNDLRRKYLPVRCEPPAPHPDNGVLLDIQTRGNPSFKERQSYVKLDPFVVDTNTLQQLRNSNAANLTTEAFNIVVEHLDRRWRERKIGLLPGDRTYRSLKVSAVVRTTESCSPGAASTAKRSGSAPPVGALTHMHLSNSRNTSRVIIPMGPGNPGIYAPARSPTPTYPASLPSSLPTRTNHSLYPPLPSPYRNIPLHSSSTLPRQTHIYRSYGTIPIPPPARVHNDAGYRYATITERGQLSSTYHAPTRSGLGSCCGLFLSILNLLFSLAVLVGFGIWIFRMFHHG